jgi:hypothetical protein
MEMPQIDRIPEIFFFPFHLPRKTTQNSKFILLCAFIYIKNMEI